MNTDAVKIISGLLTGLATAYAHRPEAKAQADALNATLRGFIDEARGPTDKEWAFIREQSDALLNRLHDRAEAARKSLADEASET